MTRWIRSTGRLPNYLFLTVGQFHIKNKAKRRINPNLTDLRGVVGYKVAIEVRIVNFT